MLLAFQAVHSCLYIHLCTYCRLGLISKSMSSYTLYYWSQWNVFRLRPKNNTTFNNGSLGSRIDEERSELRYVMWIAEFSESSNLWTHLAPFGIPKGMPVWVSLNSQLRKFIHLKLGCWRTLQAQSVSAPLKCISRTCTFGSGLIMLSMPLLKGNLFSFQWSIMDCLLGGIIFDLTSNQVGLPAELKHINKRRKRN